MNFFTRHSFPVFKSPSLSHGLKWVFWFVFFVVLFFSGLRVKNQANLVLDAQKPSALQTKQEGVGIDFKSYDFVVARKEAVKNYETKIQPRSSPFGIR